MSKAALDCRGVSCSTNGPQIQEITVHILYFHDFLLFGNLLPAFYVFSPFCANSVLLLGGQSSSLSGLGIKAVGLP